MRVLIIDDSPGRYEEFTQLLNKKEVGWIVTCQPDLVHDVLEWCNIEGIILDHDMPYKDGLFWARWLAEFSRLPVVISSTTSKVGRREEMLKTLQDAGIRAAMIPADHFGCEKEWLEFLLPHSD
jgi:DNA-binding NarL/FixJ family response regulator